MLGYILAGLGGIWLGTGITMIGYPMTTWQW